MINTTILIGSCANLAPLAAVSVHSTQCNRKQYKLVQVVQETTENAKGCTAAKWHFQHVLADSVCTTVMSALLYPPCPPLPLPAPFTTSVSSAVGHITKGTANLCKLL